MTAQMAAPGPMFETEPHREHLARQQVQGNRGMSGPSGFSERWCPAECKVGHCSCMAGLSSCRRYMQV